MSDDPDDLVRRLLDAGASEAPSEAGRARALGALGLADVVPPGGGSGNGSAGGGSSSAAGSAVKASGAAMAAKLVAGCAVVGVAILLWRWTAAPPPPAPSSPAPSPLASTMASVTASAAIPEPAAPPSPSVTASAETVAARAPIAAPSASAVRLHPVASSSAVAPVDVPPRGDDLAGEIARLDAARKALRAGDTARALSSLDEYAKAYPNGSLASEALVVRVDALIRAGRKDEAERVARPYIAAHPQDLVTRRLRALLGEN